LIWPTVQQFTLRHGVLPLLYARLKSLENGLSPELIPGEAMKDLQALYLTNTLRNLRLSQMLVRVLSQLSEAGIPVMPIKGPVLAEQLYSDLSLRQFSDLDILIHAEDFLATYRILETAGFRPAFPVDSKIEPWLLRSETEHSFFYQNDMLEVHWAIAEKGVQYPIKEDQLWQNPLTIELPEKSLHALSPQNLLLLLCIHGAKHLWSRLIWVADVAHFVKTYPQINWGDSLERARKLGFYRIICLGLFMAENIGGAQLPHNISKTIRNDPAVELLAHQALIVQLNETISTEVTLVKYYLRCRERYRDRVYYVLDQTFIPKQADRTAISMPDFLYPLYIALRPLRLILKLLIIPFFTRENNKDT